MTDRRAVFFLLSAAVSLILVLPTPVELRWVGWLLGVSFVVLAAASWADHRGRTRHR